MEKITDWTFYKAGGFGKYNGWGAGMVAVPACVVGGFFVSDK